MVDVSLVPLFQRTVLSRAAHRCSQAVEHIDLGPTSGRERERESRESDEIGKRKRVEKDRVFSSKDERKKGKF